MGNEKVAVDYDDFEAFFKASAKGLVAVATGKRTTADLGGWAATVRLRGQLLRAEDVMRLTGAAGLLRDIARGKGRYGF